MIGSVHESAFSQLIVARILMQQTRENSRGHIRADAVVREGFPIALSVGCPALSPRLRIIFGLRDGGKSAVERIGRPVEDTRGGKPEFLAGGEWWKGLGGFDGPIVGEDFENAIVYGSRFLFELALPNLIIRRLSILVILRILGLSWL